MSAVTIVRHGDTFAPGEPPRRIGARTDPPLVASGREQASRLRAAFDAAGVAFASAFTSPLRRTRETLDILIAGSGVPAATADWLAEIDHGPDEDQPEAAVIARIGCAALAAWEHHAAPPSGWVVNAAARLAWWRAFLDAGRAAPGEQLLVTSNGAARFALLAHPGLAHDARALPSLKLRTGAWGRLRWSGDRWRIERWDERP